MSNPCAKASAPINLLYNSDHICDLKCDYKFNYSNSGTTIYNTGNSLKMSYEEANPAPVIYNGANYQVKEVRLFRPSLHSWGGMKVDAELIIIHQPQTGNASLLACIPIKKSSVTDVALLSTIISKAKQLAQSAGQSTTLTTADFNLNGFIPVSVPFYAYDGSLPFDACSGTKNNYIVFDAQKPNGFKTISEEDLTTLKQIIDVNGIPIRKGSGQIYYNSKGAGASLGSSGGEIYIDCQPTGSEGDILVSEKKSDIFTELAETYTLNKIMNNPLFEILIGVIVFIIVWKLGKFIFGKLGGGVGGSALSTTAVAGKPSPTVVTTD